MTVARRARSPAVAVLVAVAGLHGCGAPRAPIVIESPAPPESTSLARHGRPYQKAIAVITRALEEELGAVAPPFRVVIHPDRTSLADGLAATGQSAAFARATAETMDGVGGPGWVLMNGSALGVLDSHQRTAMLTHEVVHVLQYAWAGGTRGASAQWLREGFAEWLTARVMVRLGLTDHRDLAGWTSARQQQTGTVERPALQELQTFSVWLDWVASRRDAVPYAFAALAVQRLVERHGVAAVVDYFRRFATSHDADGVFRDVFGETVEQFDLELRQQQRRDGRRR